MPGIHVNRTDGSTELIELPEDITRDEAVAELMKVRDRGDVQHAVLSGVPPVSWDR